MSETPILPQRVAVVAVIRPGLLDRLKDSAGLTEEAMARAIGISRSTLHRLRNGEPASIAAIAGISAAFDLGLGEVAVIRQDHAEVA